LPSTAATHSILPISHSDKRGIPSLFHPLLRAFKLHRSHGKTATLTGVFPPSRFGELSIVGNTVQSFNEKPQVSGGHINGGFFVFNRNFLDDYLDDREDLVLEREPMEKLAAGGELKMFEHDGFWQPMDTPREYSLLNDLPYHELKGQLYVIAVFYARTTVCSDGSKMSVVEFFATPMRCTTLPDATGGVVAIAPSEPR